MDGKSIAKGIRFYHRWQVALISAAGLLLLGVSSATAPTLSDVLAQAKVRAVAGELPNLEEPIWDYAQAANEDRFAICYFVGNREKIESAFHLAVKDLRHGTWREVTLDLSKARVYDGSWLAQGSCTNIHLLPRRTFTLLEYGPSAGTTLQFDNSLRLQYAFPVGAELGSRAD